MRGRRSEDEGQRGKQVQACVEDSHRHSGNRNRRVLERFVVYITRLQDAQEGQDAAAQQSTPRRP